MKTINLTSLRAAIDGVDAAIAGLLATRHRLWRQVIEMKVASGRDVFDSQRERQIRIRYVSPGRWVGTVAAAITQWCRVGH